MSTSTARGRRRRPATASAPPRTFVVLLVAFTLLFHSGGTSPSLAAALNTGTVSPKPSPRSVPGPSIGQKNPEDVPAKPGPSPKPKPSPLTSDPKISDSSISLTLTLLGAARGPRPGAAVARNAPAFKRKENLSWKCAMMLGGLAMVGLADLNTFIE